MSDGGFTSHKYTNYIVTGGIRMVTINKAFIIKVFFRQQQPAAGLRTSDYKQEETRKQNIPGTKKECRPIYTPEIIIYVVQAKDLYFRF